MGYYPAGIGPGNGSRKIVSFHKLKKGRVYPNIGLSERTRYEFSGKKCFKINNLLLLLHFYALLFMDVVILVHV